MRLSILFSIICFTLLSCGDDTRSWESDTNGPPANMATCNQDIDENTWPADNRTGNPAYHLRKEKELEEQMKNHPQPTPPKE